MGRVSTVLLMLSLAMTEQIGRLVALNLPRKDEAEAMLKDVAVWVQPIMRKHGWVVPVVEERCFRGNVIGMNINRGQKIQLRLRRASNEQSFFELDSVLDTMLHELAHNVHGNHSSDFYELWDELRNELQANRAKNVKGSAAGFDAKGYKLSGEARNPSSLLEARKKAVAAAEKRQRLQTLTGSGPQTLGGSKPKQPVSAAQAAALAAMKRWSEMCGTGQQEYEENVPEKEAATRVEKEEPPLKIIKIAPAAAPAAPSSTWACEVCTYENEDDDRVVCEMCDHPKPGLWLCQCGFANNSLFECKICSRKRNVH